MINFKAIEEKIMEFEEKLNRILNDLEEIKQKIN